MSVKLKKILFLIFLTFWMVGLTGAGEVKELHIGTVTQFPSEKLAKFQVLADYLKEKLAPYGVTRVRIVLPGSLRSMGYLMDRGKVDLFFESPLATLAVNQIADLGYLLRQWQGGVLYYHAVLFARKDGPVKQLKDLIGVGMAMEEPNSTMGYLVPKYFLEQKGFDFVRIYRPRNKPPSDKTGFAFTFYDSLALEWVNRKLSKTGVVNNLIYEKRILDYPDLKILYESPKFYRKVVTYRADMDPVLRDRVKEILLTMHLDPRGKKVLKTFDQTTLFDEFPEGGEAYEKSLAPFVPFLQKELNL